MIERSHPAGPSVHSPPNAPTLEPGDRLDQKTFHARYEKSPGVRAELIGGTVHTPSLLRPRHGRNHARMMGWLWMYENATPGVEVYDNTTAILGAHSEPQPDAFLIVAPEKGGQMRWLDDYLVGPPEWIGEVGLSTESIDLHDKRDDYQQAGVKEYLVIALRQQQIFWHVLRNGRFEEQVPADGIFRSECFPGLWLDGGAFLQGENQRLLEVLGQGLVSNEHQQFAKTLAEPA